MTTLCETAKIQKHVFTLAVSPWTSRVLLHLLSYYRNKEHMQVLLPVNVCNKDQQRRLEKARCDLDRWQRPSLGTRYTRGRATTTKPMHSLLPSEGLVTAAEERNLLDPLGLLRVRHDVEVFAEPKVMPNGALAHTRMEELMWEQAAAMRPLLSTAPDQAQRISALGGEGIVENRVHTMYIDRLDAQMRELQLDEVSEVGTEPDNGPTAVADTPFAGLFDLMGEDENDAGNDDEDDGDAMLPTAPSVNSIRKDRIPFFSLAHLRRRWLPLGFQCTKVGTALAIHYATPWQTTQQVFPVGRRLYTNGANNARNDRIMAKHGTIPFMSRAVAPGAVGKHRIGVVRRISQNTVVKRRLEWPRAICLGLLQARGINNTENKNKVPLFFKNIRVKFESPDTKFTLLIYSGAVLCSGTSTLEAAEAAFRLYEPMIVGAYNTPENEAVERAQVESGVITPEMAIAVLNYRVTEDGQLVPQDTNGPERVRLR